MADTQKLNENKRNGSYKGIGMIIAVITVLVGIGSIMQYMDREVGFMNERIERLSSRLDAIQMHFDQIGKEQAANQERFKEVETQFLGMKEKDVIINRETSKKLSVLFDHVEQNNAWRREHMMLEMGQKGAFDALKEKTSAFSASNLGKMEQQIYTIEYKGTKALIEHVRSDVKRYEQAKKRQEIRLAERNKS